MAQKRGESALDETKSESGQSGGAQRAKGPAVSGSLDFAIGSHRLGKQVIEADNVTITYNGQALISQFNELVIPGNESASSGRTESGKRHF